MEVSADYSVAYTVFQLLTVGLQGYRARSVRDEQCSN